MAHARMGDNVFQQFRRRPYSHSGDESALTPLINRLKPESYIISVLKTLAEATRSAETSETLNLSDLNLASTCSEVTPFSVETKIRELARSHAKWNFDRRSYLNDSDHDELDHIGVKGVVVGRLTFRDIGDTIDCTRMGVGGKAIPSNIDVVDSLYSDALFILLVENHTLFVKLADERFYNRFPCIIVSSGEQLDDSTGLFVMKMAKELRLPVISLVDSLKIFSGYNSGSKNLYLPDIKWLGFRPSDLEKYKIPEKCRLQMTDEDIKTCKDLLKDDFVKKNPGWVEELNVMVKSKQKVDITALCKIDSRYLSRLYLPLKLQELDWL